MRPSSLKEVVDVLPRFCRSVNLQADLSNQEVLRGYVISPLARDVLYRILDSLRPSSGNRAWAIVGPYGSGKSSFAAFLSQILDPPTQDENASAREMFSEQWPAELVRLEGLLDAIGGPQVVVPVTGERAPLAATIVSGLLRAATTFWSGPGAKPNVLFELQDLQRNLSTGIEVPGSRIASVTVELAHKIASSTQGHTGLCLIIDEFGKLLEWIAQNPHSDDIFLLQQLAEAGVRATQGAFSVVTVVHQSFDAYAEGLPRSLKEEWTKVEGRFELVPYLEPPSHLVTLVGRALHVGSAARKLPLFRHVMELVERLSRLNGGDRELSGDALGACFPLNPVTAACLGSVFRLRLGQNERSLFAFLASDEPGGFQQYLAEVEGGEEDASYCLHHLYDYLMQNTGVRFVADSSERTWAASEQALARLPVDATASDAEALKAVAILSLVGSSVGLKANIDTIAIAIGQSRDNAAKALQNLETWSAVVYRDYKGAFQVWDGSDLDVVQLVRRWRREVEARGNLARQLQKNLPPRALAGTRHYYQTGTLRYLRAAFLSDRDISSAPPPTTTDDGVIYYVVPDVTDTVSPTSVPTRTDPRPVVFALPAEPSELKDTAYEYFAVAEAIRSTPELAGDPVARRELEERKLAAQDKLNEAVARSFGGVRAHQELKWYHRGSPLAVSGRVSAAVSTLLDECYKGAPCVKSELVNRHELSSAAAGARRVVMERLVEAEDQELLGIKGHPPELAIYLSVLKETGLHQRRPDGTWTLVEPTPGSIWEGAWEALHREIKGGAEERVTFLQLMERLAEPPIGLREGLSPIVLLVYYLLNRDQLFVYEDNTLVPTVGPDIVQRLLRSPESFELQHAGLDDHSADIVRAVSEHLFGAGSRASGLLALVKPIVRLVSSLSHYGSQTQRVSYAARRVRSAARGARDPRKLVFVSLPDAVDVRVSADPSSRDASGSAFGERLARALRELKEADRALLEHLDDVLRSLLRADSDTEFCTRMAERASRVARSRVELSPQLRRFVTLACGLDSNDVASRLEWARAVATAVTGKLPEQWNDDDVIAFEYEAANVARAFRSAEHLAVELGKLPDDGTHVVRLSVMDLRGREQARVITAPQVRDERVSRFKRDLRDSAESHGLSVEDAIFVVVASLLETGSFERDQDKRH